MRNPQFRGKPLCVGKDIVLAASYEAKFFGVYTGMPIWEAKKILPEESIYCLGDMEWYAIVSKKLIAFLRERFESVMPASIDESFIRCDERLVESYAMIEENVLRLQQDILQHVGLPVSIGVGPTKLLAKMAADWKKPLGYTIVIEDYQIETLLDAVSVRDVPFIGSETFEKIKPYVTTALGYSQFSLDQVKTLLGHHGVKIWYELNAISVSMKQLGPTTPGSIGRTKSFNPYFTAEKQVLWNYLQDNIARARKELYAHQLGTRLVRLSVKSQSFDVWHTKKLLQYPINDFRILQRTCRTLFDELYTKYPIKGVLMRATGVSFGDIGKIDAVQPGLFSYECDTIDGVLNDTIFSLKQRYGNGSIQLGAYIKRSKRGTTSGPYIFAKTH